jgi:simple sugar transport system permease protein
MIALGMTFVIATSGIDLSVGSVMAVGGAIAMVTLSSLGQPDSVGAMFAAIGLAVLLGAVLGAVNGFLVAVVGLQPFISTSS